MSGLRSAAVATAVALIGADAAAHLLTGAPPMPVLLFATAMSAMVAAGVVVGRDADRAGLRRLLVGVAIAGCAADLASALPAGPFPFLAVLLHWPYVGLFAHLLMRWPDVRLDGILGRGLLLTAYGLMPVLSLLGALTWRPASAGVDASGRWWPTIAEEESFSAAADDAQQLLYAALILVVAGVVVRRSVRARGRRRREMRPVTVAAVLLTTTVALGVLQRFGVAPGLDLAAAQDLAVLAVPVGVLVAVRVRSGAARARVHA